MADNTDSIRVQANSRRCDLSAFQTLDHGSHILQTLTQGLALEQLRAANLKWVVTDTIERKIHGDNRKSLSRQIFTGSRKRAPVLEAFETVQKNQNRQLLPAAPARRIEIVADWQTFCRRDRSSRFVDTDIHTHDSLLVFIRIFFVCSSLLFLHNFDRLQFDRSEERRVGEECRGR